MGNPHAKKYSTMYLLNSLAYMSKQKQASKLIKRIRNLSEEMRAIFVDDMVTAMENRLKVFERREERL